MTPGFVLGNFRRTICAVLRAAQRFIFWHRDKRLADSDNLPNTDVLVQEIVEDLEAALEQFREIANDLGTEKPLKKVDGS